MFFFHFFNKNLFYTFFYSSMFKKNFWTFVCEVPLRCSVNYKNILHDTIRYEMLFYVRSKADMSRLNLPHGNDH